MTDEMNPERADEMGPEDGGEDAAISGSEGQAGDDTGGEAVTEAFAQEPLAGEGTDDDEATVTEGPAQGGTTGKAGQGTADEKR